MLSKPKRTHIFAYLDTAEFTEEVENLSKAFKPFSMTAEQFQLEISKEFQEIMARINKKEERTGKFLAFDLEISKQIPQSERDFFKHSPLGISVAATYDSVDGEAIAWYETDPETGIPKEKCSERYLKVLVGYLKAKIEEGYTILTWNGLKFDFRLLAEESGEYNFCAKLAGSSKHIDMMYHYFCVTGYPVAMQSIAEAMDLPGKTRHIDGKKVPSLWKTGQYDDVIEYAKQDAQTVIDIYHSLEKSEGRLFWVTRRGYVNNRFFGTWKNVQTCGQYQIPARSIWDREDFFSWMETVTV